MWKCRDVVAAVAGAKDDDNMILVTGATGLSGSAVIRACVDARLPVRALVRDRGKVEALGVIDRPVRYVDTDPADYRNTLLAGGIPAYFADAMDELFSERRDGTDESSVDLSTHGVFGVTPITFTEFARRNADVFRGEAAASQLWASGWQSTGTVR
jgi:NmrA-like family